ncbi:TrmH family RNA methyltransferase [Chitinimonas lacunae]|uniref:TrmH family RNA methyltransferase n=1 Tax=Chitinimonas lacunae TaxID=1963018 RepID=A0ABV8MUX9_9NEIS
MDLIQSRQNPHLKHLIKLASHRRDRLKSGQTVLDGPHLLAAALDAGWAPQRLFVTADGWERAEIRQLCERAAAPVAMVDAALFAEASELESLSGVLALLDMPPGPAPRQDGVVLVLDGVQDPGNVGSILRSAAAAGVDQVWLSPGCADVWSPKVLRAGMGAHFVLPLCERLDLAFALQAFAGTRAVTALEQSVGLYQADLSGNLALVMGSEGQGVSASLLALADLRLRIPMRAGIESLNVAAAAAVCLFERWRQSGAV